MCYFHYGDFKIHDIVTDIDTNKTGIIVDFLEHEEIVVVFEDSRWTYYPWELRHSKTKPSWIKVGS